MFFAQSSDAQEKAVVQEQAAAKKAVAEQAGDKKAIERKEPLCEGDTPEYVIDRMRTALFTDDFETAIVQLDEKCQEQMAADFVLWYRVFGQPCKRRS